MEAYDQDSKETSLVEIIDSAQRKLLKLQCKYNTKTKYITIYTLISTSFALPARIYFTIFAVRIYLNDMLTTTLDKFYGVMLI